MVQKSLEITDFDFGYKYGAFRSVDRFVDQIGDDHVGLITWPGGTLSEKNPDRYGLNFDGLFNPALKKPGLADMFSIARDHDAGLSVVLPTARYEGNDDALRSDIRAFMGKVLSGHYGTLPAHLQFEIGNEWYFAFGGTSEDAHAYGHVADIYVDEISAALNDPSVNRIGADIGIAVQAGRSLSEDALVRSEFHDDHLAEVDMVIHHRFAFTAAGIDKSVDEVGRILDAWEADSQAVGGDRPELFLGAYNVASLTRDEALHDYIKSEAALGHSVNPADIDMEHRTDQGFETFWQAALGKRDYGAEHPRLLLEAFAEYGGEGMGAASTYGSDMEHAGRLSTQDAQGHAQDFVGQDMLDMLGESTTGTRLLKISLTNDRGDDVWTYAYESADKLVVFLSADDVPPGKVTVAIKGLGTTYKAVYGDSLTAQVPDDWMTRFGVPDTAGVDETNEANTYAIGIRQGVTPTLGEKGVTVDLDTPYEVVRLSFAKTDAGLTEIEGFSDDRGLELDGPDVVRNGAAPHHQPQHAGAAAAHLAALADPQSHGAAGHGAAGHGATGHGAAGHTPPRQDAGPHHPATAPAATPHSAAPQDLFSPAHAAHDLAPHDDPHDDPHDNPHHAAAMGHDGSDDPALDQGHDFGMGGLVFALLPLLLLL